ncbi:MAG: chromosomal replication initiator protein DnaA [Spirochaetia bacterium]|nr:chromosomal replication initiator protein DnaA [Spirochaetota bacterium]MCX8097231.1 chromosomal replication initiator protein DnaA [Spirochaetota bacterium]MDW8111985.1 chromosomal replication initiator protein DnaA [Spirochaetia bacterium]
MEGLLRVWEEFVNIVTIGNEFDKVVLSKVKPYYKNGKFVISVNDEFTKTWIEKNYLDRIISTFKYYDVEVELVLNSTNGNTTHNQVNNTNVNQSTKATKENLKQPVEKSEKTRSRKTGLIREEDNSTCDTSILNTSNEFDNKGIETNLNSLPNINPRYSFESFVIGPSNDFAYHSALEVSKYPGKSYNPLFIYGEVGLGKTHLLHAIANEINKTKRLKKVVYVTSEQFTNEFFKALSSKSIHSFRMRYREVDILLIDDVQFFKSTMRQAIEELFHTFNKLAQDRKQMVFTSDRPPKELEEIDDRLISRFEGGLVVEIKKPELETRLNILERKFKEEGIELEAEILNFIAESIVSSVRALESAVNRVCAFLSFKKGSLDISTLKTLLKDIIEVEREEKEFVEITYTVDDILKAVSKYYETSIDNIISGDKGEDIVTIRQISMYLAKRLTNLTFSQIGSRFGKVHSTAMRAYERIDSMIKKNLSLREQIKEIISILKSSKRVAV